MPIFKFPDRYFSFCSYNGTDRCFKLNIRLEIFPYFLIFFSLLCKSFNDVILISMDKSI